MLRGPSQHCSARATPKANLFPTWFLRFLRRSISVMLSYFHSIRKSCHKLRLFCSRVPRACRCNMLRAGRAPSLYDCAMTQPYQPCGTRLLLGHWWCNLLATCSGVLETVQAFDSYIQERSSFVTQSTWYRFCCSDATIMWEASHQQMVGVMHKTNQHVKHA